MQRTAGNAAVGDLLRGPTAVQREGEDEEEYEASYDASYDTASDETSYDDAWSDASETDEGYDAGSEGYDAGSEGYDAGSEGYDAGSEDTPGAEVADASSETGGAAGSVDGEVEGGDDEASAYEEWATGESPEDGTTEVDSGSSEVPHTDWEAEAQYVAAVEVGDNAQALNVVLYRRGFGGPGVASISYAAGQADAGLTSGPIGQPQTITIGPSAFTSGFSYCAAVIGHELQHAQQRQQSPAIEDPHVREFLAYSWEVLESRENLSQEDIRVECVQAFNHFAGMSGFDQAFYEERNRAVHAVYNRLQPVTLNVPPE